MALTYQERGRLGGQRTVARHGREHMRALGQRGFRATVAVIERPGQGAVAYDRYAWLLHKLYPRRPATPFKVDDTLGAVPF